MGKRTYTFRDEADVFLQPLTACLVFTLRSRWCIHAEEEAGSFEGEGLGLDSYSHGLVCTPK
jgi:hypothetical protein